MESLFIKQLSEGDSALAADLFDQYRVFYGQPSDLVLAHSFLEQRLKNQESVIFMAFDKQKKGNEGVGFTQLYPTYSSLRAKKNWILNDLFVRNDFRGKGVARALISAAESFASTQEAQFIQLETAYENTSAQRLYEWIGYQRSSKEDGFYLYKKSLKL